MGAWALNPHVMYLKETDNESDFGDGAGHYFEFGIAPSRAIADGVITLSAPIRVGNSIDDYYQNAQGDDDFFGYIQGGICASIPLDFMSNEVLSTSLGLSADFFYFGDNVKELNGEDDRTDMISKLGIYMSF